MARDKAEQVNIDNSDPQNYPNKRIKNNTGADNGTPVDESVYGDIHEFFAYLMRNAGISYSGTPDNVGNGYQLVDALFSFANKNNIGQRLQTLGTSLSVPTIDFNRLKDKEFVRAIPTVNFSGELTIKGKNNSTKTITTSDAFVVGDLVTLVYDSTADEITILKDLHPFSLISTLNAALFFPAATLTEELAGVVTNKTTVPAHNLEAFIARVNGDQSDAYLATELLNGLLSKQDKKRLNILSVFKGWINGLQPAIGGSIGAKSAGIASVTVVASSVGANGYHAYRVVLSDPILGQDENPTQQYYVEIFLENSTNAGSSSIAITAQPPFFHPNVRVNSPTSFDFILRTYGGLPLTDVITRANFKISLR